MRLRAMTAVMAAVADLEVSLTSAVGATLVWTAPEIDGAWVQDYVLRVASAVAGDFARAAAVAVTGAPTPSVPGATEICRATGMVSGVTYHAALRFGADGRWLPVSNVVTFTTIAAPPIPSGFVYVPAGTFSRGPGVLQPALPARRVAALLPPVRLGLRRQRLPNPHLH